MEFPKKALTDKDVLHLIARNTSVSHNGGWISGADIARVFFQEYVIFRHDLPNMVVYKTEPA